MVKYVARSSHSYLRKNQGLKLSLGICCCWIVLFAQPVLSQPARPTISILDTHTRLLDLYRQVFTIGKDLSQLRKALGIRDPERSIVSSLVESNKYILAYVAHAMDVLWLYQNMSSPKDRENVRKSVGASLKELVKLSELEIEATNDAIANTDKPGIVSTATELRNATRQIIDALNAVQL